MLCHFQNGRLICGEGTVTNCHYENDINIKIMFLATNHLSFTDQCQLVGMFMGKFVDVRKRLHCGSRKPLIAALRMRGGGGQDLALD